METTLNGKKILVLYATQYLGPRLRLQLETMAKRNMQIVLLRWKRSQKTMVPEPGWQTVDIPVLGATGSILNILALPKLYRAIQRESRKTDFDIILASSLTLLPLAIHLAKRRRVPVVYDAYEYFAFNYARHFGPLKKVMTRVLELLENIMITQVSGILTVDSHNDCLINRYQRVNPNSVILHNVPRLWTEPPVLQDHRPALIKKDITYVAYIGTFNDFNGGPQILEAVKNILGKGRPISLLLMGFSADQDKTLGAFWHLVQDNESVTCFPFLPYSVMMKNLVFSKLGFAVYQQDRNHEMYGTRNSRKLFTYMSAGLPVIVSRFPLVAAVVKETGCGLIVDETSPAAIAEAITYLLDNPSEARAMGQRGRQAVEQKYNWEREEPKFWQVFQRALESREAGKP